MEKEQEKKESLRIRAMFFELDKDGSGAIEKNELALLGEHLFGEICSNTCSARASDRIPIDE